MVVLTALMLALPAAIQYMIDTLIPRLAQAPAGGVDYTPVLIFGAFLLGIYLFELGFSWLRDYLVAYVGAEIIKDIRAQLFGHLQRLPLAFHGRHQTGEMMSRLLSDVGRLQDLLTVVLLMVATNVLMLFGILIYLLNINWTLTLVAIVPIPFTVYTTSRLGGRLGRLMAGVQQRMGELSARLQESLIGIKTVKAFGQEAAEDRRVDRILRDLNPLLVKASVTSSLGISLSQFINMTGPIVVLAWGAYLVAAGTIKLGALIAFYLLLTYLYSPVRGLAEAHLDVRSAMASADRIFEYLDEPPAVRDPVAPITPGRVQGEVRLDEIDFAYDDSRFRLRDFSLTVRPREKVALVGPSGAGKTTVINLIMRFADPAGGTVSLDGHDLRTLSAGALRRNVALVEQEPLLFRMSIRDNIAYGRPEASEAEVVAAAQAANIHAFATALPDKYGTVVGERGVTISGGERQRLCLARAILLDPAVLLLDEATSALDSNSEQLIQKSLGLILRDKTAIIIAHRLATIQHVDRIVVMDAGRIVDEGTHAELLGRSAVYGELARHQMLA
jgi:subfamily B ATP-binding cassette protein MsbA